MAFNFKNPEEVQAYLKNIYTEYKFGCESEKNGNACHLLGDYMEGISQDFKEAADIYKANCDERNWPRSCAKFGTYKLAGKGCEQNADEALKYMTRGCELKDPRGCVQAGVLSSTLSIPLEGDRAQHIKNAMKFLELACHEHNEENGCFYLASIHMGALKDYVEPNLKEAYKLNFKSCEMGNPYACANISQMHARGEGAQKNEELAKTFKERALLLYEEVAKAQKTLEFQQGIPT